MSNIIRFVVCFSVEATWRRDWRVFRGGILEEMSLQCGVCLTLCSEVIFLALSEASWTYPRLHHFAWLSPTSHVDEREAYVLNDLPE